MTPLQMHVEKWTNCDRCSYALTRRKIVLGKGDIPCDILFIGEAPGPSENMIGKPFIGKAGKLLDRIIAKILGPEESREYRVAFNNIISCIPLVEGHEKEEPDAESVLECQPRLAEFIEIADPKLIVLAGKLAEEWFDPRYKKSIRLHKQIPTCVIQHPSAILRMPSSAQSLAEHRAGVIIATAIRDHLQGDT